MRIGFATLILVLSTAILRAQDVPDRVITISGSVTDSVTGRGIAGALVILQAAPGKAEMAAMRAQIEQGGDSASRKPFPAAVPRRAVTKGQPVTVLSMTVQGATHAGGVLNVPETGDVNLTIIADASAAQDIPGRALRGDKPEGGLLATLVPSKNWDNTTLYRFDQSDSDGTFTWRAVPPGEYLMFAFEAGEPLDYASAEVIRGLVSKAQKITITGDTKQTAVVHVTAR